MKRVCGECWYHLRPTEYAPNVYILGDCDMCGYYGLTYRVSNREIEEWSKENRPNSLSIDSVPVVTGQTTR